VINASRERRGKLSGKSEAAKSIDLKHWTALRRRFLD
jgi:hypothetical protein